MKIRFSKYQGAGNDFVLIDNRKQKLKLEIDQIQRLCHRNYGIGSDGLILLEESSTADFDMQFFNPDGSSGMMCGNGGRCVVAFANNLNLFKERCVFNAPDGLHKAELIDGQVRLQMIDTENPIVFSDGIYMNTGTSHFVCFVDDVDSIDVETLGRKLRFDERFTPYKGANVNFVSIEGANEIKIRTYERGVEAETLACGTGITASAIAYSLNQNRPNGEYEIKINSKGGRLKVCFTKNANKFTQIWLQGGADFVFEGEIGIG